MIALFIVATHFEELLRRTLPPDDRLKAAQELPDLVRDYLRENDSFETVYPHSRLIGAYSHDTCSGDVKDVDIIIRIPWDPEEEMPGARQILRSLKAALAGFAETTDYGAGTVELRAQGRSVRVEFVDYGKCQAF